MSSKQRVLDRFDERANEKLRNFQQIGLDKIDDICKDLKDEARDKLKIMADRMKEDILEIRERAVIRLDEAERKIEIDNIVEDFNKVLILSSPKVISSFEFDIEE